jgi:hypothetical protein
MAGFKNLEDLVGDLGEGLRKLRAGALEPEELDPLVVDARELCDRLILLRFKAHEFSYEVRKKAPQGGLDDAAADRQPVRPFRIGAAYQTSLIDAIEEVSREQAEQAEEARRSAGVPELFDAVASGAESPTTPLVAPDVTATPEATPEAVETPEAAGPTEEPAAMTAEPDQEEQAEQAEVADTNDAPDEVVATGEPEPAAEESMAPVTDTVGAAGADQPESTAEAPTMVQTEDAAPASLAEKMERQPIKDLRKAFSLVEKYECIKMLFADDAVEFNRVLDALEEAGTYELALHWLGQQVPSFGDWDSEDPVVMRFLERVERRYQ